MDEQTESQLQDAILYLRLGQPEQAYKITSTLFEQALESEEVIYTNRCCVFWIDSRKRLEQIADPYVRSENTLNEWKSFKDFITRETKVYEPAFYAVKKGFFTNALNSFSELLDCSDSLQKAEMYRRTGICYKKLGDFENARTCLIEANNAHEGLASVLAEMADCYSLCGEDRIGKVLFREAFFQNPEAIDLNFLDSQLIKCLVKNIQNKKGYTGKQLLYWIPVYGVIGGIFNIKRPLSSLEVARLAKNIYQMENEYKDPSCNEEILVPKLLNSYFWLIDHYVLTHESVPKINEILLKIKILDSQIYEAYTNQKGVIKWQN